MSQILKTGGAFRFVGGNQGPEIVIQLQSRNSFVNAVRMQQGFSLNPSAPWAPVMRSVRTEMGLSTREMAGILSTSQSRVVRFESGRAVPHGDEWIFFCRTFDVPAESMVSGHVDREHSVILQNGNPNGYRIPDRYGSNRGTSVRATLVHLTLLEKIAGPEKVRQYLDSTGLDPLYLVDLDHTVNARFTADIFRALIAQFGFDRNQMRDSSNLLGKLFLAGAARYGTCNSSAAEFTSTLVGFADRYDSNCSYKIEDRKGAVVEVSVRFRDHVASFAFEEQVELAFCEYFRSIFSFSPGGRGSVHLIEKECQFGLRPANWRGFPEVCMTG